MKKRTFWGIVVGIALILVMAMLIPVLQPYTWGGSGELALTITSDRTNLTLKGEISATYTLTNVGKTKMRVLEPQNFFLVSVRNANGTSLEYTGPVPAPPAHGPTDADLFVLEPGKSRSWDDKVMGRDWAFEQNKTYKMVAYYNSKDIEGSMTLPYWKGTLTSNEILFTVLP